MVIVHDYPPNIEKIRAVLKVDKKGIIYTYGDTLYNPDKSHIDTSLLFHEETHAKQQKQYGIDTWWGEYLTNKDFRLRQEVEAYRNQFKKYKTLEKDRNKHTKYLHYLALDLASEIYGNIISYTDAKSLLK